MLTNQQLDVLIGSILGDGSLSKTNFKSNSRFSETHSEAQLGWLTWKNEILKPFSTNIFSVLAKGIKRLPNGSIIKIKNKFHKHFSFKTISNNVFTEIEKKWYKRDENGNYIYKIINNRKYRIKVVPEFELTKLTLAVWYIDDGDNGAGTKQIRFSTQDTKIIQNGLKAKQELSSLQCLMGNILAERQLVEKEFLWVDIKILKS